MGDERPVTDESLNAFLDEVRADEAARARSRQRWLQQQAQSDARLSGVLLDAAEHGHDITVHTSGGQSRRGQVTDVGEDWCLLTSPTGRTLVHTAGIAAVTPDVSVNAGLAGDHRTPPRQTNFVEALGDLAADRPRVVVEFRGPAAPQRGELVAVGADVATLRTDGTGAVAYVSLASVAAVSLPSG